MENLNVSGVSKTSNFSDTEPSVQAPISSPAPGQSFLEKLGLKVGDIDDGMTDRLSLPRLYDYFDLYWGEPIPVEGITDLNGTQLRTKIETNSKYPEAGLQVLIDRPGKNNAWADQSGAALGINNYLPEDLQITEEESDRKLTHMFLLRYKANRDIPKAFLVPGYGITDREGFDEFSAKFFANGQKAPSVKPLTEGIKKGAVKFRYIPAMYFGDTRYLEYTSKLLIDTVNRK